MSNDFWLAMRRVITKLLGTAAGATAFTLPATGLTANYSFIKIADNSGPFGLMGAPSINAAGTVTFFAEFDAGGAGVFAGSGGPLTTIADTTGSLANFGSYQGINDAGVVVFSAYRDDGSQGVFSGNGGAVATIADSSGTFNGFGSSTAPSINNSGVVAFYATYATGGGGIFINDGGVITTVADTLGPYSNFDTGGANPSINDLGLVAFFALLDNGRQGVFTGNGGPVATVMDDSGPFYTLSVPSINNGGALSFGARLDPGMESQVVTGMAGSLSPLADTSGPFSGFAFTAINESANVAFRAQLVGGGSGIYTGPDAVADKVIQTGDPLFGSTVTSLIFVRGLSDGGHVAFRYELANGVEGVAVARLVPEPSTAILLMLGLATATLHRRRLIATRSVPWMLFTAFFALIATVALPAAAASYNFINIADSSQFIGAFGRVSINNHGAVAFAAPTLAGGSGVFTGSGGPITTIVDSSGTLSNFSRAVINDAGMVAFEAFNTAISRYGVYVSGGGPVTTIVETGLPLGASVANLPAINANGTVAFRAFFNDFDARGYALYTGGGGPLTPIADARGALGFIAARQHALADDGTVVFTSTLDGGGFGLFAGDGGPLDTIASSAGGLTALGAAHSLNADGTVAFLGAIGGPPLIAQGIYTTRAGGPLTAVADASGPFSNRFADGPVINDNGAVAFVAELDAGGVGIFTGPDPVAGKVIQTGDPLFGSTVAVAAYVNPSGEYGLIDMNNNGDVAFRYELANGTVGIAVARLVPEPGALAIFHMGIPAMLVCGRASHQPAFFRRCGAKRSP